jgi:HEAT repeat protein
LPDFGSKESQAVYRLVINARLISDAIFLLGELGAVEAVPVLIHIMENGEMYTSSQPRGIEMDALCRIGAPAVPFLIKSIENAKISAAEAEPVYFGFSIEIDSEGKADGEASDQQGQSALDDPDFEQGIEQIALSIKRKALDVLGEIGDKEALPFLENLTQKEGNKSLVYGILATIKRIKSEPSTLTGPQSPQSLRTPKPLL